MAFRFNWKILWDLARVPLTDISSEFRYRRCLVVPMKLLLLSQSGETADTLACIREAKNNIILSFVNVGEVPLIESPMVLFTQILDLKSVLCTKNYIGQILTIYLFALYLVRIEHNLKKVFVHIEQIEKLPCN